MKILQAIPSLEIGGAEKIVSRLSTGLAKKGHDVAVLMFKEPGKNAFELPSNVRRKVIQSRLSFKYNFLSMLKVLLYLRKEKFDVVHTHLTVNNTFIRLFAALANTPVIIGHEHGGFLSRNKVAGLLLKKLENRISYNLYISEHDLKHFTQYDGNCQSPKNKIVHNPLLVNIKPYSYNAGKKLQVIGMVGRIIDVKGHMWALRALLPFIQQNLCRVVIVGDGDEAIKQNMLSFATDNQIELHITGYTLDIEAYLSTFDVLVHPSFSEGFGLAIIEAMAFGVPVIGSKVGGIPGIIEHGENGLLFEPNNPADLQEKISRLSNDAPLRERISRRAYQFATERFSFDRYVSTIEDLYNQGFHSPSKS